MSKYKVCLIVDNPLRDLDGIVLTARALADEGIEVYLVPYHLKFEVFLICPDYILVNYVRNANRPFLENCRKFGMLIGVLDTEGGILRDWEIGYSVINKLIHLADGYFTWGKKQYEMLELSAKKHNVLLLETGCPRYDFCASPWKETLPQPVGIEKGFILLNTNFSFSNSRFQGKEKELQTLIVEGYSREYAENLWEAIDSALNQSIAIYKKLAEKYSDQTFVLRPHPFEGIEIYKKRLGHLKNFHIRQEGTVFHWLHSASLMLHYNCATSLDSFMMGVDPVQLSFIDTNLTQLPDTHAVSICVKSFEELENIIDSTLAGKMPPVSSEILKARENLINGYFHALDGKASKRVSDAIINQLEDKGKRQTATYFEKFQAMVLFQLMNGDIKRSVINLVLLLFGTRAFKSIKKVITGKGKTGKEFYPDEIQKMLDKFPAANRLGASWGDGKADGRNRMYSILVRPDEK